MVYAVSLKWASYKQDILNVEQMLSNQCATYAILRYAQDIPESLYKRSMNLLLASIDRITNKKLSKLMKSYAGVAKVGIVMDEEFVETIEVPAMHAGIMFEDTPRGYSIKIEDIDED